MFIINPYKLKSKSARKLAMKLKGRIYKPGDIITSGIVINWGDGKCSIHLPVPLNRPEVIKLAANKLRAFDALSSAGVSIPRYAKRKEDVSWKGLTVVRHKLTGHSGEGIEICENPRQLPDAPLYVEYIKKQDEYRIHCGRKDGNVTVLYSQRKARNLSIPNSEVNWQVRNHDNGFVFVRGDVHPPESVLIAATAALSASGLDFGAVDVIYNAGERKAYVLEINTAPGLEGQSIEDYATFFKGFA